MRVGCGPYEVHGPPRRVTDLVVSGDTRPAIRLVLVENEIEVLIVTGATTGKVEANNTAIKNFKRTARGYRNPGNYKSAILMRSAARTAA
jgi:hypothetical protein